MIIDGRRQDAPQSTNYDLVIVGAGPAGVTLAHELIGSGLRVALLESGGDEFDPDTQLLYDGVVTGLEETDLTASRLRFLGGTSNHWGGHCLPLDEIDFSRSPLGGQTGWPFSKADLDPFYLRAHAYCDIGAFDYDLENVPGLDAGDLLLPDVEQLRTEIIRQSKPTNFGLKYRKSFANAEDVDLWLWTNATKLDLEAGGQMRALKTATLSGVERDFVSHRFVLACGAVENARILLAHNALSGHGIGDEGGLLGRCYMDHTVGGAAFLWPETPPSEKAYWAGHYVDEGSIPLHFIWRLSDPVLVEEELGNTQFFIIPVPADGKNPQVVEADKGWRGLKNIVKWAVGKPTQRGFELSEAYCNTITSADAMALDLLGQVDRDVNTSRLLLRYESEQRPDPSNRVSLSTARDALGQLSAHLHWSPGIEDRDSIVRSAVKIGEICGSRGFARLELEDHFDRRYWDAGSAWHQMGTTRMALSPKSGVVDQNLRVHGTNNLYVAGGSTFPSGGRANPTLTVVALSVRLADYLKTSGG